MLSMTQAAKTIGRSKLTLMRDIKNGKLSATRSDQGKGEWEIDPAELHRVYSPSTGNAGAVSSPDSVKTVEIAMLRRQLDDRDATIADLRIRLDRESEERRETLAKLTALLIAPKRHWWKFGR